MYIYHPCLLDRAQNSQPCSSCGLGSVHPSLPFGLRNLRQINAALAVAQLAPQIHKTLSPVSGLGTRRCTADSDPAIPSAVALGQKGGILFMGFPLGSPCGKSGPGSLYPHHWVYLKEPKPPLNKSVEISATTGRFCSRRHLFCCVDHSSAFLPSVIVLYHALMITSRRKSCELSLWWSPLRDLNQRPPLGKRISCSHRRRGHMATWTGLEPVTSGATIRLFDHRTARP